MRSYGRASRGRVVFKAWIVYILPCLDGFLIGMLSHAQTAEAVHQNVKNIHEIKKKHDYYYVYFRLNFIMFLLMIIDMDGEQDGPPFWGVTKRGDSQVQQTTIILNKSWNQKQWTELRSIIRSNLFTVIRMLSCYALASKVPRRQ